MTCSRVVASAVREADAGSFVGSYLSMRQKTCLQVQYTCHDSRRCSIALTPRLIDWNDRRRLQLYRSKSRAASAASRSRPNHRCGVASYWGERRRRRPFRLANDQSRIHGVSHPFKGVRRRKRSPNDGDSGLMLGSFRTSPSPLG